MKKIFTLYVIIMVFTTQLFSQTIPNSGFETWIDANTANSWNSVNLLTIHSLQRTTDKYSGTYAAKVQTQSFLGQTIPGIASLGNIDIANQSVSGGIPFTSKPVSLKGYFKYTPVGNDSMLIAVLLTRTLGGIKDTIGGGVFSVKTAVSNYTQFNMPIYYDQSIIGNPDTVNIILLSSAAIPFGVGSSLFVDELVFDYSTDIKEVQSIEYKVFPNPAQDVVNINCKNSNNNQVLIYNITGQVVYNNMFNTSQFKINTSDFKEGIYFIKISNKIQKLIVKHNND